MRYLTIDIETTGLDPATDQILEIGAVMSTGEQFEVRLAYGRISGNLVALRMNAQLIADMDSAIPSNIGIEKFGDWLNEVWGDSRILVAGKNVTFDLSFLAKAMDLNTHHRVLDPAMLYIQEKDSVPPGLYECARRAGIEIGEKHRAMDDARYVVQLLKAKGI